jgi:hypothetical protein
MTRAIVLGGGGVTGIAWEIGVLSGLADGGVDLRADAVIGTSAGAFVGAALASGTELEALFAAAPGCGGAGRAHARRGPGAAPAHRGVPPDDDRVAGTAAGDGDQCRIGPASRVRTERRGTPSPTASTT